MAVDDSLGNVMGRAWLVEHLKEIHEHHCPRLLRDYRETRGERTADRREFVDSVQALSAKSFFTAQAVRDGRCDVQDVVSVLIWRASLDAVIDDPNRLLGLRKAQKDAATGFGSKTLQHDQWREIFELEARRDPSLKAMALARLVVAKLNLDLTDKQVLRAIRNAQKISK